MDLAKTGRLIRDLRREKGMTQQQFAAQMNISDKTVSKWERGLGLPDVSLLPDVSRILGVDLEGLLSGKSASRDSLGGNMKRTRFYVCPACGNTIAAMADATISCCGKRLIALRPAKAEENETLSVEIVDGEYFVTSNHPMTRDHYISFVALLTGDSLLVRKQYPEWDLQVRLPMLPYARLIGYCTRHGLFEQRIER